MSAFTDNFPGSSLNAAWTQKAGSWAVSGGTVTPSGAGVRRLVYNGGDAAADGDFGLTISTLIGAGNFGGVVARWADNGTTYSGYALVADENFATYRTVRYDAGTPTVLEDGLANIADGDAIILRLSGTNVRAVVNGTPVGTGVTDATYASGSFGIIDDDGDMYSAFSGALAGGGTPIAALTVALAATGANP